jgi:thymidylate kinase
MKQGIYIVIEGGDGAGTTTQADRLATRLRSLGNTVQRVDQPSRLPEAMTPPGALAREMLSGRTPMLESPLAAQMVFVADRIEQHARVIDPALQRGEIVVSDRGELSTLVYGTATHALYRCSAQDCHWRSNHPPLGRSLHWNSDGRKGDLHASNACLLEAHLSREEEPRDVVPHSDAPGPHQALFAPLDLATALLAPHALVRRPDVTVVLMVQPEQAEARRAARGLPQEAFDGRQLQERVRAAYRAIPWLIGAGMSGRYCIDSLRTVDATADMDSVEDAVWGIVSKIVRERGALAF